MHDSEKALTESFGVRLLGNFGGVTLGITSGLQPVKPTGVNYAGSVNELLDAFATICSNK